MKRFIILLALALGALVAVSQNTYTLIASINNYRARPDLNDLPVNSKVAKRIKSVMAKQPNSSVSMLTGRYATRDSIVSQLHRLCDNAQPGDRIFFFYLGHGAKGALAVYDSNLPYHELMRIFKASPASQIFVFVEACHSASVEWAKGVYWNDDPAPKPKLAFFMSSQAEELTWSEASINANGYVDQAVVLGLKGLCDEDQNKQITVRELEKYITSYVVKRSMGIQHPQLVTSPDNMDEIVVSW